MRMNRSRYRLGWGLAWAKETCIRWGCTLSQPVEWHQTICVWRRCCLPSNYWPLLFLCKPRDWLGRTIFEV